MKIEQAIEVLNDIHLQCCDASSIFNTIDWKDRCKALDMAIEALSAQSEQDDNPCENCQEFDCYGCEYKRC